MVGALEARPNPLPGHLDNPEPGDPRNPAPGLILAEELFHGLLECSAVGHLFHIDKIDNDEPAEIPQAQLLADDFSRLEIRFKRSSL